MRPEASSADGSVTAHAECYRLPDTEIVHGGGTERQAQAHTDDGGGDPVADLLKDWPPGASSGVR
jgi:hypothetical protein